MYPLDLIKLTPLIKRTSGIPDIRIGLIDGPVATNHPDLAKANIKEISGHRRTCELVSSTACRHGTYVAGILSAKRASVAPAISPNCTLLVRPIFSEVSDGNGQLPSATSEELAIAIIEIIEAGAKVLNLSVALVKSSSKGERELVEAINYAVSRGVIPVAAAGNQGMIGSTIITRHIWVIPVVAYDSDKRPIHESNFGSSIGKRGLGAPGKDIMSIGSEGKPIKMGGTSAATPFVTGTIALLWSEFPEATAGEIRTAIYQSYLHRRRTVIPPLLDAWAAYQMMVKLKLGNKIHGKQKQQANRKK